ncbi:MAG: hypothetical protein QW578_06810 [Thermoplasmatales archaeon]
MKTSTLIIAIIGIAIIGYLVYKYVYQPRKSTEAVATSTTSTSPATSSNIITNAVKETSAQRSALVKRIANVSESTRPLINKNTLEVSKNTRPLINKNTLEYTQEIVNKNIHGYTQALSYKNLQPLDISKLGIPSVIYTNPVTHKTTTIMHYVPPKIYRIQNQINEIIHQSNPTTVSTGTEITKQSVTGIAKYINPVEKSNTKSIVKGPVTTYSPTKTYSSVHQSNPTTVSIGIGKYIRPLGGPTTINKKINIENPPSIGVEKYIRPIGGIANPNGESKTVNRNSYSYIQEIEKINKPFIKTVSAITKTTQPQKTTTSSSSSFTIHRPGLPTFSELKKQNPFLR